MYIIWICKLIYISQSSYLIRRIAKQTTNFFHPGNIHNLTSKTCTEHVSSNYEKFNAVHLITTLHMTMHLILIYAFYI